MSSQRPTSLFLSKPPPLDAEVRPPGSKSLSNRALLLAGLARGRTELTGLLDAEDTSHMRTCLERLGVSVLEHAATHFEVEGRAGTFAPIANDAPLFAGSAGTVARFLTAVLAAAPGNQEGPIAIDASAQMRARPMAQLLDALSEQGAKLACLGEAGHLPVEVAAHSSLRGGLVSFARPASSQLVSALVLAGNFARAPLRIVLREGTPARPYVDMTLRLLAHFGGRAQWEGSDAIAIEPTRLVAHDYDVEPDASSASYFLTMAAIHGGRVRIPGLGSASAQGDAAFFRVLERMGARVQQTGDATQVDGQGALVGIDVDLSDMPDMALTLAVAALFAKGATTIRGVEILRHHETDRLAAAVTELRKLGARVDERDDGLHIEPPAEGLRRAVAIDTYEDHRMAMAFGMVGDVEIRDPGCVAKTFPSYFDELAKLCTRSL